MIAFSAVTIHFEPHHGFLSGACENVAKPEVSVPPLVTPAKTQAARMKPVDVVYGTTGE